MSCIAGVCGEVKALEKKAQSPRPIIVIDGCHLHCAKACLSRHDVEADVHVTLSDYGLRKRYGEDCSAEEADRLFDEFSAIIASDRLSQKA